jgi:hypothetical protein
MYRSGPAATPSHQPHCCSLALVPKLAPHHEPALPPSKLVAANALRSAIPEFFMSSDIDPNLRKILNHYRRTDIQRESGQVAA